MNNALETLKQRGFVKQSTDEKALEVALDTKGQVFYIGFDPTADSLHAGSLVPIMAIAQLQRAGHFPICIIGGGTTMIGDPSGKTEMRRIMTREEIDSNGEKILAQLKRYAVLDGKQGLFLNNADWLLNLNYIDFLRDIGRYFKINEMIRSESYKQRLDRQEGLSFIEFNYQVLQAYDFLVLFNNHNCTIQMGGDDQWGNILAGNDLIRKVTGKNVHALTFPLLTTAAGRKMGKTESGTIWLDPKKTSPYEFYQYWINTDDRDVVSFLKFFTFLPFEQIKELEKLKGADIRQAKEILAFETTKLAHGEEEAEKARKASRAAFGKTNEGIDSMPTSTIARERFIKGVTLTDLFIETGLAETRAEVQRLAEQGGAYVQGEKVLSAKTLITEEMFREGELLLSSGKKKRHRVVT
ncbi:MAG: tyrosine--tRNA ligase [Candidatus Zambryskibacteria bacterium]|nr:tyrosine--tRNA ligase [Candidatus Zambryskibacteria bacterium]